MVVPPWKPIHLAFDLDRRVEQLFTELIHEPWGGAAGSTWQPAVDLYETDSGYVLEADLPGVRMEDIELHVSGRLLTIRGRRESVTISHTPLNARVERAQGEFSRQFKLEHPIDVTRIESQFQNGIYRAWLPKTEGQPSE